jgi:hypothetical protein
MASTMREIPKSKLLAVPLHRALATLTFSIMAFSTMALVCAGCGGAFGTANPTSPGKTSTIPAQNSLWVLGTPGTPFQAVVTDSSQSWTFRGVVPQSVVIINASPGVQMTVTKLTNNAALMTTELINGTNLVAEASTNDPFGTTVVQSFGGLAGIAPKADPDIRFFMKGPSGGLINGLIEDLTLSFVFQARSPALFLFERPDGRVDAIINSVDEAGLIIVDILSDGAVVTTATGGPRLLIKH